MDSIEKFFQIKIHNPAVTRSDILLRLRHGLMSRPTWPETITAVRKRLVPLPLQNLHHRLRRVGSAQQLLPHPQQFRVIGKFVDGHAVDPRATFVGLDSPHCFLQVFPLTYLLHGSIYAGWAFGFTCRRERFDPFPSWFLSFTRNRDGKVQFPLDVRPLGAPEIHDLLAAPFRSGLRFPVPGLAYPFSPPFGSECLTSLADGRSTLPSADFCPEIGAALRPASVARRDTGQTSRGKFSRL